ncbi:hypothetical protein Q7C36_011384 [Tachysurus vachellii]|uniref:Uncharacterized protein n=1 Tax=Tachysurus vachellii TaxID=175792 RepID=A0AA88SU11_TACVA|nr:hypothetical protein Q7C36_011384 [Tachysurus vachellii]
MRDTQRQADTSEDSENDSDDDSGLGYWLKRQTKRMEERPVTYQGQLTRYPEIRGSEPAPVSRESHTVPVYVPNPTEKRCHADENLPLAMPFPHIYPSVQTHAAVNSVTGYTAPYIPVIEASHHTTPWEILD